MYVIFKNADRDKLNKPRGCTIQSAHLGGGLLLVDNEFRIQMSSTEYLEEDVSGSKLKCHYYEMRTIITR